MPSVYKPTTTQQDILEDGWSRGFQVQQTMKEAADHGCPITEEQVKRAWELLDLRFESSVT